MAYIAVCSRLSSMFTVRPRVSDPSSGSNNKGLSILSRFGWRLPDDSMGIFASSPPGEVTPHSARKVQKMPANGILSELRAHQMALDGIVAHSSPPAGVVAHSSPPAGFFAQVIRSLQAAFGLFFLRLVLHVSISSILVLVL